jgi:hypothetical protein
MITTRETVKRQDIGAVEVLLSVKEVRTKLDSLVCKLVNAGIQIPPTEEMLKLMTEISYALDNMRDKLTVTEFAQLFDIYKGLMNLLSLAIAKERM